MAKAQQVVHSVFLDYHLVSLWLYHHLIQSEKTIKIYDLLYIPQSINHGMIKHTEKKGLYKGKNKNSLNNIHSDDAQKATQFFNFLVLIDFQKQYHYNNNKTTIKSGFMEKNR